MKIEYILGRTCSGKTYEIMTRIKEDIADDSVDRVILLVPEQFTLHSEFDLINKMNLKGLLKVEVLSFKSISYGLVDKRGLKTQIIDDIGKFILINKIINSNKDKLKIFNRSKEEGLLKELLKIINHFKENYIDSELIGNKLKEMKKESILKNKLEDIHIIINEFEDELRKNYLDEKDVLNVFNKEIEHDLSFKNTTVYIDGFNSFSKREYQVLENIIINSKKTVVSIPYSKDTKDIGIFSLSNETYRKFTEIEKKYNMDSQTPKILKYNKRSSKEIIHMERQIYSYPWKIWKGEVTDIKIKAELNRNVEIENLAMEIHSLIRDFKYRWKDIAIISNEIGIYQNIIKRIFLEYEIPFFLDETRNINNNSLIEYVVSILNSINNNLRYEDLFRGLKTGLSLLDDGEVEELENYTIERGIRGKRWFEEIDNTTNESIETIRKKLIEENRIEELYKGFKNKSTVKERNFKLYSFLTETGVKEKLDKKSKLYLSKDMLEKANEITQVWNALVDILNQMDQIVGEEPIKLKDYIENLQAGLSNYKIGSIPPSLDQVTIGDLERSRSRDLKAIFLIGVNDGMLPKTLSNPGILDDEEQDWLNNNGLTIELNSKRKIEDENFLIYLTTSKPKEKLYMSFSLSTNDGKALRPSILIDRIKSIFPSVEIRTDLEKKKKDIKDIVNTPASSFKYLVENLREYIEEEDINSKWFDLMLWYKSNPEHSNSVENTLEGLFYTNQKEYIEGNKVKGLYTNSNSIKTSISRVESFSRCPFSHFVRYGLKPKERKSPEIKKMYMGTIFHNIIERYFTELKEDSNWSKIGKEESDNKVDILADSITEEFYDGIFHSSSRAKYLINKLKRVGKKTIWIANTQLRSGSVDNIESELTFGSQDEDSLPPIKIEVNENTVVNLEGKIDRIDYYSKEDSIYINIIDYKSGNKDFDLSEIYYGLQMQLITYMSVFINKNIESSNIPGGVFYFKIKDPLIESGSRSHEEIESEIKKEFKLNGIVIKDIEFIEKMDSEIIEKKKSDILPVSIKKEENENGEVEFYRNSSVIEKEDFSNLIEYIKEELKENLSEILKGKVKIEPFKYGKVTPCDYCDFISICQFDSCIKGNEYRVLDKMNNTEILKKIREKLKDHSLEKKME